MRTVVDLSTFKARPLYLLLQTPAHQQVLGKATSSARIEDFMKTNLLIWTTFLVLLASAAYCDTYRWDDKNGVHFTDNLGSIPKKYKSKSIAEAREDIKGVSTPEIDATSTSNSKPNNNTDKTRDKQEQPLNLDKANGGMKIHDPRNRHQKPYGNQTHGVEEAQRSAYENQTPARKAMNQAEERIRQSRQALDAGGSLPPKRKQQHYRGTPPQLPRQH